MTNKLRPFPALNVTKSSHFTHR